MRQGEGKIKDTSSALMSLLAHLCLSLQCFLLKTLFLPVCPPIFTFSILCPVTLVFLLSVHALSVIPYVGLMYVWISHMLSDFQLQLNVLLNLTHRQKLLLNFDSVMSYYEENL